MNNTAAQHAELAGRFGALIDNVTDWDALSPVKEWTAKGVVQHLIDWLPGMLSGMGVDLPTVEVGDDVASAWAEHSANVQALVDDEPKLDSEVQTHTGPQSLRSVIETYYLPDLFMHRWDLAKASGQDPDLDPAMVRGMVDGMTPMAETLAASGQFGVPVVLDDSHSDEERLVALIGRDPEWRA